MIQKRPLVIAMQNAHTKCLRIKKCSDSLLWYANLVGKDVPFIRELPEGYLALEPAGYTNIVLKSDAEFNIEEKTCR